MTNKRLASATVAVFLPRRLATLLNQVRSGRVARLESIATKCAICTHTARSSRRPSRLIGPYSVRWPLLRTVGASPE